MTWKFILSATLFSCMAVTAQDYQISSGNRGEGFKTLNFTLPSDIELNTLEGEKWNLSVDKLTIVQIWGTCCGAEPEVWAEIMTLAERYKPDGLDLISVNFENGSDYYTQKDLLNEHFKNRKKPERLYFDSLGGSIDGLQVRGFPTYVLVEADGTVVFTTNGKSPEGMQALIEQIDRRL